jgi:hypothetical protein
MEKMGKEYYPELISMLLSCERKKEVLEQVIRDILPRLPKLNALKSLLEAYGWRGDEFDSSIAFDYNAIRCTLTCLYYSQIWVEYTASRAGTSVALNHHLEKSASRLTAPGEVENRLAGAFCPNVLYQLLSSRDKRSIIGTGSVREVATALSPQARADVVAKLNAGSLELTGVCMLADISGFTKMSATFCERGLEGLDDLHAATSGFLGAYVQIVYSHGGDGKYLEV